MDFQGVRELGVVGITAAVVVYLDVEEVMR